MTSILETTGNGESIKSREDIITEASQLSVDVKSNVDILLQGLGFNELSLEERLNRKIPILDIEHIKQIVMWGGLAILSDHIATKGGDIESIYHYIFEAFNYMTPEVVADVLNAVNDRALFFLKGKDYGDGALLGFISSISMGVGFAKGVIPWRGDQYGFQKKHIVEENRNRETGRFPYEGFDHIVGIGMKGKLSFADVFEGTSFVKALRQDSGDIVPIQREGPFYEPAILGTKMNDTKSHVNLSNVLSEGTAVSENYLPAIVSGAFKAKGIFINATVDSDLFSDVIIDNEQKGGGGFDISTARYLVKHAVSLRNKVFQNASNLKVAVVSPKFLRQKHHDHDVETTAIESNFNGGNDYELTNISPEDVFVELLVEILREKGMASSRIYIDTEGTNGGLEKAKNCAKVLKEILGEDIGEIIIDPEKSKEAEVCILLREKNRDIGTSSRVNKEALELQYIFYPSTTREDVINHINKNITRIPIQYNRELGRRVVGTFKK